MDLYRCKACRAEPVQGLTAAAMHLVACEAADPNKREQASLWLAMRAVLPPSPAPAVGRGAAAAEGEEG